MSMSTASYDSEHHDGAPDYGACRRPTPPVRRGDIFYADLSPVIGSEQGGLRPVLIVQNDVGNRYSPTVIAAAITSRMGKTRLPTHIDIYADRVGLAKDSVILLEQIRTLDKRRLREKMGHLDETVMAEVNNAIAVSFGLHEGSRDAGSRDAGSRDTGSRDAGARHGDIPGVARPNTAAAVRHTDEDRTVAPPSGGTRAEG